MSHSSCFVLMFLIGTIVGTFGNKGDVKINPSMSPDDYLVDVKSIFVEDENGIKQEFNVLRAKKHKNIFVFTLEGIDDMNVAENLSGLSVYLPNFDFIELQENEYLYHDLEGLTAYTSNGDLVGKIDHVIRGGNDILVIKDENGKEIMVPFADELVPEVNLQEKTVTINAIDGLI